MPKTINIALTLKVVFLITSLLCISLMRSPDSVSKEVPGKEQRSENTDHSSNASHLNNVCLEAVIPFLQVDLTQDLYLILNTPFFEYDHEETGFFEPLHVSKYFKNLFLFVICINAP
jgi:hypothetical protein